MVQFSNRRSRRADARRVEILRAAARVFRTRGFAATGMREIAVAADLSPANLYHYFRGKDELLYLLPGPLARRAARRARRRPARRRPAARAPAAPCRSHVLCLLDEVEGSAAHSRGRRASPPLRAPIVAKRDRYERGVRALVAEGIRERSVRRHRRRPSPRARCSARSTGRRTGSGPTGRSRPQPTSPTRRR